MNWVTFCLLGIFAAVVWLAGEIPEPFDWEEEEE